MQKKKLSVPKHTVYEIFLIQFRRQRPKTKYKSVHKKELIGVYK